MTSELDKLLGKEVLVFCTTYFYSGILESVDADTIALSNASIVYETGSLIGVEFRDAQPLLRNRWIIFRSQIESMGLRVCER